MLFGRGREEHGRAEHWGSGKSALVQDVPVDGRAVGSGYWEETLPWEGGEALRSSRGLKGEPSLICSVLGRHLHLLCEGWARGNGLLLSQLTSTLKSFSP